MVVRRVQMFVKVTWSSGEFRVILRHPLADKTAMALSLNIHKLTDAYMNGERAEELRKGGRLPMVGIINGSRGGSIDFRVLISSVSGVTT